MTRSQARSTARPRSAARRAVVPAALLALAAAIPGAAFAQEATPPASEIGVLETAPDLVECEVPDLGEVPTVEGAVAYQIVPEESATRYRVAEELATVGVTEAVGETRAMLGAILLARTACRCPAPGSTSTSAPSRATAPAATTTSTRTPSRPSPSRWRPSSCAGPRGSTAPSSRARRRRSPCSAT
jgi:hypothetical protein